MRGDIFIKFSKYRVTVGYAVDNTLFVFVLLENLSFKNVTTLIDI